MPNESDPPALAVVVMGYRNAATIVAAVRSVVTQVGPEPFEVVVVTSGGDDSAARVRAAFPGLPVFDSPVRLLPGAARNAGIARTAAPVVSFLAADCEARPGWVAARLRAHGAGHRAVAGAMASAGARRPALVASLYLLYARRLPGRGAGLVASPDPAAHGLSLERSLVDEIGPFDEEARIGEDGAVARRLGEKGVGIWFEPAVQVAHRGPGSIAALVADEHRRGLRVAQVTGRPAHLGRSWSRVLLAEARLVGRGFTTAFRLVWAVAPRERRALVLCAPWMLAGAAARRAGRLSGARTASVDGQDARQGRRTGLMPR